MKEIRRRSIQVLAGVALMVAASAVARANTIIDPVMRVLDDDFSNAILQGTSFFPNGSGGGVFGFFNGANQNITEITFQAAIQPNLDAGTIASAFNCNQGNGNPFFFYCAVTYVPNPGTLQLAFWGTNPVTNPGAIQQGIPTLPAGCTSLNADSPGCTTAGHFAISLSDSLNIFGSDQSGGWSSSKNPTLFATGEPVFLTTQLQYDFGALPGTLGVPEPAPVAIVGGGLAALLWLSARRRKPGADPDPESQS